MPDSCDGCTFWKRHTDEYDQYSDKWGVDRFDRWGNCHRENLPDTPIYSQDASNYASWIITRDDFGCVEWRPA